MSGDNLYIPVRVSSAGDIPLVTSDGFTLESTTNSVLTIDGVNVIVGDWILIRYQVDDTQNGLYRMTQLGIAGGGGQHWILKREGQGASLKHNMIFQVIEGTLGASKLFRINSPDPITSGFTSLPPTTGIIPSVVDFNIGSLTVTDGIISLLTTGQAFELNPTGAPVTIGRPYTAGQWLDSLEFNPTIGRGQAISSTQNMRFSIDSGNVGTGYEFNFMQNGYGYVSGTKLFSIADNGSIYLGTIGNPINEFSTDGTLSGNSNLALPTEQAVKTYVDGKISGGTNNHIVRWDGTNAIQDSAVSIDDTSAMMNFLPTNGELELQVDSTRVLFINKAVAGTLRIGNGALASIADAYLGANLAIGEGAIGTAVAGSTFANNVALGKEAGYTLGALAVVASENTLIGNYAFRLGDGFKNTIVGYSALGAIQTGTEEDYNTAIGHTSFSVLGTVAGTCNFNTGLGYLSGYNITSGIGNVCLGAYAGRSASGIGSYRIGIGTLADPSTDYYCQIGQSGQATHSAKLGFYSQTVCDEAWRDGNIYLAGIDATGNLYKTTASPFATGTGTNNHIVRWDGTNAIQDSAVTIDDTTAMMNFIPTTKLLDLQVDSTHAIYINNNAHGSIRIGLGALASLAYGAEGLYNIALGENTLNDLTTGERDISIGFNAGAVITNGTDNVSIGYAALSSCVSGVANVAVGGNALRLTLGNRNVAVGESTFNLMVGASNDNVAVGYFAGEKISVASVGNVYVGSGADIPTPGGSSNYRIGLGYFADPGTDYYCQIGQSGQATHNAKLGFYSQTVCDEAWRDGNVRLAAIDASGNTYKTVFVATVGGALTVPNGITISTVSLSNTINLPAPTGVQWNTIGYANNDFFQLVDTNGIDSGKHIDMNIDVDNSGTDATFGVFTNGRRGAGTKVFQLTEAGDISGSCFLDEDNMASNSATKVCSQQSIKAYVDSSYSTGTHNTNWSGPWAAPQAGNVVWNKIQNVVTLRLPSTLAAATVGATIVNDTALPASLRPATGVECPIKVKDNNNDLLAMCTVANTGIVTIYATAGNANFAGAGSTGFATQCIHYNVN